jgi:alpha-L-fucosidase
VSNTAWGYVENHEYKTVTELVRTLVDIVSKNGNLLLNVGPKPDGTIPRREVELLRGIGAWLRTNGDAIYGTRAWWTYGEGPTNPAEGQHTESSEVRYTPEDIRFTVDDDALYAIVLDWAPELRVMTLAADRGFLPEGIASVDLLGSETSPSWYRDAGGLHVSMPEEKPCEHAYTLKIVTE